MNLRSILAAVLIAALTTVGLFLYGKSNDKRTLDISGKWDIVFYFDESSYSPLVGQNATNRMVFTQQDENIAAEGQMIQFNKQSLPKSEQIPFHFDGKIVADKIQISYTDGKKEGNVGEIDVLISLDGNKMEGTFTGKAAKSKGRISATRFFEK